MGMTKHSQWVFSSGLLVAMMAGALVVNPATAEAEECNILMFTDTQYYKPLADDPDDIQRKGVTVGDYPPMPSGNVGF